MTTKKAQKDKWRKGPVEEHWESLWVLGNQVLVPMSRTRYKETVTGKNRDIIEIVTDQERFGLSFRMQDIPVEWKNLFVNLTSAMESNRLALETFLRMVQRSKPRKKVKPPA